MDSMIQVAMYIVVGTIILAGCAAQRAAVQSPGLTEVAHLAIAGVGAEPKTLNMDKDGTGVSIWYRLTQPAKVTIDIVDELGHVERQLMPGQQPAAAASVPWDGRDASGEPVASGVFRYVIRAMNQHGESLVYDPSPQTGGEELQVRDFTFDKASGTFRWVMPKAGMARLRLGLEGFPHLRTLMDWQPMEAGSHERPWDGSDASGLIQFKDHPKLIANLSAYTLPDNTIIVQGDEAASGAQAQAPAATAPPPYPSILKGEGAYPHARHLRAVCREISLRIEFPEARSTDAQGRAQLVGHTPVRVTLEGPNASYVVDQRFEVVLFEDLTLLFEEEESLNPYSFMWDTTKLTRGPHLLTVNILSYDGHYGVATVPVVVEQTQQTSRES